MECVLVHPLVLIQIEHHLEIAKDGCSPILRCLLGKRSDSHIEVIDSFEQIMPLDSEGLEFLDVRQDQYKCMHEVIVPPWVTYS